LAIRPAFLTLCLILIVVVLFTSGVPLLDWMELKTYDLRLFSRGHVPPTPAVVLALVDEKSLATEGRWPWPRAKFAALVDHLSQDGVRVIGFDMVFLEPDENSQNDLTLAKAIKHASAAVVLGYFFHLHAADLDYQMAQEEIDRQLKRISTSQYPFILSQAQAVKVGPFLRAYALQSSLEVFTAAAASSGYFSLQNDQDGVVRWMPLTIQGGEDVFPPLAIVCAWHYLGKPQLTVEVGRYGVDGIRMGQRFIPTDDTGQLLINYLGPPKTFPHFSISDILNGKLPRGTFTDKIVLVGATATGIHDVHATPLSAAYPGVEIHATVIDNILTQHFFTPPKWSKLYDLLAIIILGALMGLALPQVGNVKGLLYATGLGTVYIIIAYWMFVHTRVWLNIVYPLLVLSMTYLGHTVNSMVQQLQGAFRDLQASEQKYRGLFADIDLLHPLAFQVEQVFLIHHETGLLLLHVAAEPATAHDPDLISSMLIAIQDFMQDSFRVATDAGPETFQIGGLTVWVEQDALAVLAAVIRGIPPQTVRTLLQETLATIHQEHAEALGAFTGDATPFATSRPLLEACLVAETAPPPSPALPRLWPRLVCLVSVHRWGIVSRIQANRRWASYVQTLRATPGIVVTAATKRRGTYCIAGLHDPLAADPDVLLATCGIDPARVTSQWQPYHALLPAFMLARVRHVLDPPETVTLELDNGVLSATGRAPHAWIVTARQQARLIPGIVRFQENRLVDADM
jgi:CHASE2 domain-containing sensor protein